MIIIIIMNKHGFFDENRFDSRGWSHIHTNTYTHRYGAMKCRRCVPAACPTMMIEIEIVVTGEQL